MKNTITIKKLSTMPYAQAHVELMPDGSKELFSYMTRVVSVDAEGFVTVYGTYSATTRKHISAFAKEYLAPLDYYNIKDAYEGEYKINYLTGEVVDYKDC